MATRTEIPELLAARGCGSRATRAPHRRLSGRRGYNRLTEKEIRVLQLAAEGRRDSEIAEELGVTEHTVKSQMRASLWKLDAANRTHAVALGLRQGLIS